MKNQKLVSLRPIIVITASAILSVLFILILYYADNKYTVGGKQPELGRLELTLGDMEENPYRYLVTGWEFYPDLLLGPDAFDGAEKPAGVTAAVGKYGQMRRNQRGTKGTYRLVLELPEKGGPFALELPEIEGASRVYIGGELVREWGSIEDVRSGMKRFVFPLTQGRDTELIIQAAALGAFEGDGSGAGCVRRRSLPSSGCENPLVERLSLLPVLPVLRRVSAVASGAGKDSAGAAALVRDPGVLLLRHALADGHIGK